MSPQNECPRTSATSCLRNPSTVISFGSMSVEEAGARLDAAAASRQNA